LIAILTGKIPVVGENVAHNEWGSARIENFVPAETLPRYLESLGYGTHFLSAGDVTFLGKDTWLKRIGFATIEGGEATWYAGQHRGPFQSVNDRVFFERLISYLRDLDTSQPYFVCAESVWSHHPYLAPDLKGKSNEEEVFRFTDQQIGYLYAELVKMGFFEKGLLIITGDHVGMDPLTREEVVKFGPSASARIPLVVVWRRKASPRVVDGAYQQADIMTSLKSVVGVAFDRPTDRGNFLGATETPPGYILQARGNSRDLIYVHQGGNDGFVLVDGDQTRFISGPITNQDRIIETVNYDRIVQGMVKPDSAVARAWGPIIRAQE
jgi:lipoteichoic acid synthase